MSKDRPNRCLKQGESLKFCNGTNVAKQMCYGCMLQRNLPTAVGVGNEQIRANEKKCRSSSDHGVAFQGAAFRVNMDFRA